VYLNIIEFGDGIYGVEAASQHYFGHSASSLSKHEAAELAATLPSPLKRNPDHKTSYYRGQVSAIQGRAARYGRVNLDRAREIQRRDKKRGRYEDTLWDFMKWYYNEKKVEGAKDDV
jgi:membrane peptidoglycan carboxypeptidase